MTMRWNIHCPHCGMATTLGVGPKQIGYSPVVSCSKCNKPLDASKGTFAQIKRVVKMDQVPDLLGSV